MKPGDKFQLKKSVSVQDLKRISYGDNTIDWILKQKNFTVDREDFDEKKIWYYNNLRRCHCYFLKIMIEPPGSKIPRGHRLTKMFKF